MRSDTTVHGEVGRRDDQHRAFAVRSGEGGLMAILNIVEHEDGGVEVWIDVPGADLNGVIVGQGETRQEAITDAVRTFEALTAQLQSPPDVWERDDQKYYLAGQRPPRHFHILTHRDGIDI
jgi:hypothetical protein